MHTSDTRIPVLVVEDNDEHYGLIEKAFEGTQFSLFRIESYDNEQLLNYKARHRESQIVVCDLALESEAEPDPFEGIHMIRERLWKVDRTALFIIFSEYVKAVETELIGLPHNLNPHYVIVPKEFEEDAEDSRGLQPGCLDRLVQAVRDCSEVSTPMLPWPDVFGRREAYESHLFAASSTTELGGDFFESFTSATSESGQRLRALSEAAVPFARAGRRSLEIGVGVYGSVGRLEGRHDSDVEFSCYYADKGASQVDFNLAVAFWNRLAAVCRHRGWRFEGEGLLQGQLLRNTDASEGLRGDWENRYIPVMSVDEIVDVDLSKHSEARNRHFQVLTELRPCFNPGFISAFKQRLIARHATPGPDLYSIISAPYLYQLTQQFFEDATVPAIDKPKDVKLFCYRLLNILATRLLLTGWLYFGPFRLDTEETWDEFLASLVQPGAIKVMWFGNRWSRKNGSDEVIAVVEELSQHYVQLVARFVRGYQDFEKGDKDLTEAEVKALRLSARKVGKRFVALFEMLKGHSRYAAANDMAGRLLSNEQVADVLERM